MVAESIRIAQQPSNHLVYSEVLAYKEYCINQNILKVYFSTGEDPSAPANNLLNEEFSANTYFWGGAHCFDLDGAALIIEYMAILEFDFVVLVPSVKVYPNGYYDITLDEYH